MAILTRQQISDYLNRTDVLDTTAFPNTYINQLIASVNAAIASYLHWNPVLSVYTDERGAAQFVSGGTYAGRYLVELHNQPLVSSDATAVFSKLQLTYPLTMPTGSDVNLSYVKLFPATGQTFCLAPGAVEALAGFSFGTAPLLQPQVAAVGYTASYSAGYACNNGTDPSTNPATGAAFTGVPALPSNILDAALLLVRERLMVDKAVNTNLANPAAGALARVRVGEREEVYRSYVRQTGPGRLGLGTPLSESAEMLLKSSVKRSLPLIL